jgi:hypothetical protein
MAEQTGAFHMRFKKVPVTRNVEIDVARVLTGTLSERAPKRHYREESVTEWELS